MSEEAINSIKTQEHEADYKYHAIKIKFFARERKIYGVLLITYSLLSHMIDKTFLTLTSYSSQYDSLRAASSYKDFYRVIYDKNKEGLSFANINLKLKQWLDQSLTVFEKDNEPKDIIEIERDIIALLRKTISDSRILMFTFEEAISIDDYEDFLGMGRFKAEEQKKNDDINDDPTSKVNLLKQVNIPSYGELITGRMVLAPIEGTPIFKAIKGWEVYVIIGSNLSDAQKEASGMTEKGAPGVTPGESMHTPNSTSEILPAGVERRGEITGTFYYEETYYIGAQFEDGTFSLLSEDAQVKVKMSAPKSTLRAEQRKRGKARSHALGNLVIWGVAVLMVFALIGVFIWML